MIIGPDVKPPVGGMGGSIHDWERSTDPWHRDSFPNEFKDQAPNQGDVKHGWMAVDFCGNQIGFVPDGYEWTE